MRKKPKRLAALLLSLLIAISAVSVTGLIIEASAKPKLAKKSVSIVIGGTFRIKLKNVPKGAKIVYKSAKKSIASVSKQGKVKGIKNGTAKITVSMKKNSKITKLTCKVVVKKPALSMSRLSLESGKKAALSIKNKPKKAKYVWSSSSPKIAAVSKNGEVTAKAEGTATISTKVKTDRKAYSLSCKVTVKKPTPGNSDQSEKIAKWAVKVNGKDISSASDTFLLAFTANNADTVPGKLAPGGTATAYIEIDLTGTEVSVDFACTPDPAALKKIFGGSRVDAAVGSPVLEGNTSGMALDESGRVVIAGSAAMSGKVRVPVTLTWTDAADDTADTTMGAAEAGVTVPVTVTVQQHAI